MKLPGHVAVRAEEDPHLAPPPALKPAVVIRCALAALAPDAQRLSHDFSKPRLAHAVGHLCESRRGSSMTEREKAARCDSYRRYQDGAMSLGKRAHET